MVAGEISTDCYVDIPEVARETIREIGYHSIGTWVLIGAPVSIFTSIDHQSPDIAQGVNEGSGSVQGAGSRRSGAYVWIRNR